MTAPSLTRKICFHIERTKRALVVTLMFFAIHNIFDVAYAQADGAQAPVNFDMDRLRAVDELQKLVENLTEKSVLVENLKDKRKPVVRLELNVDKNKLNDAFKKHLEQEKQKEEQKKSQQWQESTTRYLGFLKAAQDLQNQSGQPNKDEAKTATPAPVLSELSPRFGILNTGPVSAIPQPTPTPVEKSANTLPPRVSPSINFSAPSLSFQPSPFTYSILDYVTEVLITIHVPAEFKAERRTELMQSIVKLLGLPALQTGNLQDKIKFFELTPNEEAKTDQKANKDELAKEQPSWAKDVLNPKNQSLSGLFMSVAALFGFVLVGFALVLTGRNVAKALGNIAQAAQAKAQEGGGGVDSGKDAPVEEATVAVAENKVIAAGSRSKFSTDKEADLLSQTRQQIVDNVTQWCQKDPVTVGEVLNDLAGGADGLSTLSSLLLYTGYESIKPALELLPEKLLKKLDESLNESWKEGAELLPGLEAAQLLLAGMIPRQTALLRFNYDTTEIRKSLLKIDSFSLKELTLELENSDACTIFRLLPQGIALALSMQLPPERLRAIMEELSKGDVNQPPKQALTQKLSAKINNAVQLKNGDKQRLLRGLLKKTTQANENKILEFLGPSDLLLRFELLQERFFAKDFEHVEPTVLRSVVEKLPLNRRANFLFFADATLRQNILDLYPKGSRSSEALLEELENIERSPKRKSAASNDKNSVLALVCENIFERVKSDLKMRLSIIDKIAKSLGGELPPEIASLKEENQDGAA